MEDIEKFKEYKIENVSCPMKQALSGYFGCGCVMALLTIFIVAVIEIFGSADYTKYLGLVILAEFAFSIFLHILDVKYSKESMQKLTQQNENFENRLNLTSMPKVCIEGSTNNSKNDYQINYVYIDDKSYKLYIMSCLWVRKKSCYEIKEYILDFNDIITYKVHYSKETNHAVVGATFDNSFSDSGQLILGNAHGSSTYLWTDFVINTTNVNYPSINLSCINTDKSDIEKFIGWLRIIKK